MVKLSSAWLAPLQDDEFNRAKSNIKQVDALAARIPWLASPLPEYQRMNECGRCTGLIVPDGDWFEAMKQVRALYLREEVFDNAGVVREWYSSSKYGAAWVDYLQEVLGA
jgi:hypothetical protein